MIQNNFYVYVNMTGGSYFTDPLARFYTGVSQNPAVRLAQHNRGRVTATRGRQWKTCAVFGPFDAKTAFAIEGYLKTGSTREKREDAIKTWASLRGNPEQIRIFAHLYAGPLRGRFRPAKYHMAQPGMEVTQADREATAIAEDERQRN